MPRLRHFLLPVAMLSAALAAHADTVTTDHVVFTYNTAATYFAPAATHQYNVSFTDGVIAQNVAGDYNFGVTVYPGTDATGTSYSGRVDLFPGGSTTQLYFYDADGYIFGFAPPILQSTRSTGFFSTALYFQPGTYTLSNPLVYSSAYGTLTSPLSASFTITQTTSGAAAPVSVTPEPSSFALLGTGLLGLGGVLRRRGWAHA